MVQKILLILLVSYAGYSLSWCADSLNVTGDLTGFVMDANGLPVVNASVVLEELKSGTLTDRFGGYVFSNIPTGSYTMTLAHYYYYDTKIDSIVIIPDVKMQKNVFLNYSGGKDLALPSPSRKVADVLPNTQAGEKAEKAGTIMGKVHDIYGNPVRFADIIVIETKQQTQTNFLGEYLMTDVNPGIYTVLYSKAGYEKRRFLGVQVRENETTVKKVTLPILYE